MVYRETARSFETDFDPVILTNRRVIVIASPKGGTGKTTIAVGLAGAAHAMGIPVVTVDADETQQSLDGWIGSSPVTVITAAGRQAVEAGPSLPVSFLLVDTAGSDNAQAGVLIASADLVIIPMSDSRLDIDPALRLFKRVAKQKKLVRIVFCNVDRLDGGRLQTARADAVATFRFQTVIPRRVAVRDAARLKLLLSQYKPASTVHSIFCHLLEEIMEIVN